MTRPPAYITVSREEVADCRVFRVEKARRRQEGSGQKGRGQEGEFFRLDAPDWVLVVALTPDDEILLVRQERHGVEAQTLELPGGLVDAGERPEEAARRELREETGFAGRALLPLGAMRPNPAILNNRCHVFLAVDAQPVGPPSPDEGEQIESLLVPRETLRGWAREGTLDHGLVLAALYLLELKEEAPGRAG